ncbi:hypothetical protein K438DRAFT_1735969 [Mycena galopus ATCC 62051]|nr:hypothetical protein K438DRAFT_1735969 [Mycena galopus ATCC 62051]
MSDFAGPSQPAIQRGPRACTNCRRRKIKCDGVRPVCSQCRLRPPRSKEPCQYPRPEGSSLQESPSQMLETINALRNRVEELEYLSAPDPTRIYLNQPYESRSNSHSPDLPDLSYLSLTQTVMPPNMPEPPSDCIASLLDAFLARFANTGYFFLPPQQFRQSALLLLPFGHQDRPSPTLLSAVYLWGTVLFVTSTEPYTPDIFLAYAVQNIHQDLASLGENPQRVVEIIQAEVLLSLYYLHIASPVQGRYHASVASSIALSANLQSIRSVQYPTAYPPFALRASLPPSQSPAEESVRIDAFWAAVVIVNNLWAGVEGSPSTIPYAINVDSPWPSSSHVRFFLRYQICGRTSLQGGATITKFLNGNDEHGSSAVALFAKASILLERIIAFSARSAGVYLNRCDSPYLLRFTILS